MLIFLTDTVWSRSWLRRAWSYIGHVIRQPMSHVTAVAFWEPLLQARPGPGLTHRKWVAQTLVKLGHDVEASSSQEFLRTKAADRSWWRAQTHSLIDLYLGAPLMPETLIGLLGVEHSIMKLPGCLLHVWAYWMVLFASCGWMSPMVCSVSRPKAAVF